MALRLRRNTATALGLLMPLSSRVDPLLCDVAAAAEAAADDADGDPSVAATTLSALASAVGGGGGAKAKPETLEKCEAVASALVDADHDNTREAAALALGALAPFAGDGYRVLVQLSETAAAPPAGSGLKAQHGRVLGVGHGLAAMAKAGFADAPEALAAAKVLKALLNHKARTAPEVRLAALEAVVAALRQADAAEGGDDARAVLAETLAECTSGSETDRQVRLQAKLQSKDRERARAAREAA